MNESHTPLRAPEPFELLQFFETPPCEEDSASGLWCYSVAAREGWKLLFCFSVVERWLKTQVTVEGTVVEEVVQEGATRLWIEQRPRGQALVGECDLGHGRTRLEIMLRPDVSVHWSTLIGEVT